MPQTLEDWEICNLALNSLGRKSIGDLAETSEEAVRCNLVFEPCKAEVLREHDWRFATVTEALALATGSPAFSATGWAYTYDYPSECDFIRKVFIDTDSSNPDEVDYEIIQDPSDDALYIGCDYEDAYVKFTRGSAADTTIYDALFLDCLVKLITCKIAFSLTRDRAVELDAIAKYEKALAKAKLSDRQEDKRPIPKTATSSVEDAR